MFYQFPAFGSQFSQCFTSKFVGPEVLTPAEKVYVEKVAEKRALDFSTGRFCARRALEGPGFGNAEILMGANKEPLWPAGIVGSISHSQRFAGAIVSNQARAISLGLDIETVGGVKTNLWGHLFTEHEQGFLKTFSGKQQELFATLLFSLKESFYKLQYPLTGKFLEFSDIEIRHINGNFSFHSDKEFIQKMPSLEFVKAQWTEFEDQVICFCYLDNR